MDAGTCPECGTATDGGARFCASCGAVVGPVGADRRTDADLVASYDPPPDHASARRGQLAGLAAALVGVVALLLAWPSPAPDGDVGQRTGQATRAALPPTLELRWDVAVPAVGGALGAGPPPVRLPEGAVAVADVVVDTAGSVVAARPPGAVEVGAWAVAAPDGLVVGEVASGLVTAVVPWPSELRVEPVGPALAWLEGSAGTAGDDVVVATSDGGAVRVGLDGSLRWVAAAVPFGAARGVTSDGGPLVPARAPGASAATIVLDLRDGLVVAEVDDALRLLAVGHGLAVTADEDGVVAGWSVGPAPAPVTLPGTQSPVWRMAMAPGRPVAVDVLAAGRLAVHGMDSVVGEVRLVDAADGSVVDIVAGWPNADLDGGRTAEAFTDVVAGVVGDELDRFRWDGEPLASVPLGSEGWFVTRGDDLVQLVSRRTGTVLVVDRTGDLLPAAAPPPSAGSGTRLVAGGGTTVGIAGGVMSPTAVRWVDALTGELDVPPPSGLSVAAAPASVAPGVLGVAGPVGGELVVVDAATVAAVGEDGVERWRQALPARPALVTLDEGAHPGLVVTSDHVVLPLADGTVLGVARGDGRIAWTASTGVARAVVGAGDEVVVASVTGELLRVASDGHVSLLADLGVAASAVTVAGDVVVALLPGRLVGIGPPGGPVPAEDRVELSASSVPGALAASSGAAWWHAALWTSTSDPGG